MEYLSAYPQSSGRLLRFCVLLVTLNLCNGFLVPSRSRLPAIIRQKTTSASVTWQNDTGAVKTRLFATDPSSTSSTSITTTQYSPYLAVVDGCALVLFAAVGKASHTETGSMDVAATLGTAAPFLTAWYGIQASGLTATQSKETSVRNVLQQTVVTWSVAVPLGIVLRSIGKGYAPPIPFVVVTMVATLVVLVTGRLVHWYAVENLFQNDQDDDDTTTK